MCLSQEALGETWVLYDTAVLASMLICLITYSVYIQSLVDFQPQDTYEVYDSLGRCPSAPAAAQEEEPLYLQRCVYDPMLDLTVCFPGCSTGDLKHSTGFASLVLTSVECVTALAKIVHLHNTTGRSFLCLRIFCWSMSCAVCGFPYTVALNAVS